MTNQTVGRNDPCPCGSGLKSKKCCLGRRKDPPDADGPIDVHDEIRQTLQEREFDSIEDVNAFMAAFTRQHGGKPREDFAGLTSEQMHRLLYFPLDSPDLVSFPETLAEEPGAPILTLFNLLVAAIGEQGLKPTVKGNLPRSLCREAALAFWGEETYRHNTRHGDINKERDFIQLHVTRLVAEMAGLVRKFKGRFILSRTCRSLISQGGLSAIYPRLFLAYARKFNWAYWSGYREIPFIQQSFLFALFLLNRYGDDWRSADFYENHFLRAFPRLRDEVEPLTVLTSEQLIRSGFTSRTLVNFAGFLGLATVEPEESGLPFVREYRIKKTPLLDKAVLFCLKR
jgi:hypothetical protein